MCHSTEEIIVLKTNLIKWYLRIIANLSYSKTNNISRIVIDQNDTNKQIDKTIVCIVYEAHIQIERVDNK